MRDTLNCMAGWFTKRYTFDVDSLVCQVYICRHLKILWNLIMVQVLELHPVNVQMNAISKVHLPVALIHTKFERSSRKTTDHGSILSRVNPHHRHVEPPTFCMPEGKKVFFLEFHFKWTILRISFE